ncbi:MAG: HD domain-containing protein [Clostridiales bacterium]|nr:HD domain-containing protein [Clostridiales bacterium]
MKNIKLPQELKNILNTLEESGFEAYLVGGAVRDYLLGLEVFDYDISTSAKPNELLSIFEGFNIKTEGIDYGSLKLILAQNSYEITTFRKDISYSDHRRPDTVLFTDSLEEDLLRRDFTVNAMALSKDGKLVDPLNGKSDLNAKLIRTIKSPDFSFNEDALRILRALRFASALGFEIEQSTKESIFKNKELLSFLSASRITEELTGILCGDYVIPVLKEYRELIAVLIPELRAGFDFEQNNPHHEFDVWEHTIYVVHYSSKDPITRWAALMHDIAKPICYKQDEFGIGHFKGHAKVGEEMTCGIMKRLNFKSADISAVCALIRNHYPVPAQSKKSVKKALLKLGYDNFLRLLSLIKADNLSKKNAPDDAEITRINEHIDGLKVLADSIIAENECFSLKDLKLSGFDVMALGYKNREVGEVLDFALNAVIDEHVANDRASILKYISENY